MQNFSPFPLRARGSLEIFDAAIKLYKQYFWVLLGWSAIVSSASLVGSIIPMGGFAAIFLTPLAIGSVICCVAASVRGQRVEFKQCWDFTQPRYWMMVLLAFLTWIIATAILFTVALVFGAIFVGGAFAFQSSTLTVQIVMGVLAFLVLGTIGTILSTVFFSWMSLVPIVICMEEDKRGTNALGRAYEILRGHWMRITILMAIVGLALLAILVGAAALIVGIGQISDLVQGRGQATAALWLGIAAMGLAYVAMAIVFTPLYYLILSVFYLDVRVRQEALDLEWAAHTSAPVAASMPAQPAFIETPHLGVPEYSPLDTQLPAPAPSNLGTRPLSDEPINQSALELTVLEPRGSTPASDTSAAPRQDG